MWLQSFAGKYFVLLFYPLDWTFVCPTEIVEFSDLIEDFQVTNKQFEYLARMSLQNATNWADTGGQVRGCGRVRGFRVLPS